MLFAHYKFVYVKKEEKEKQTSRCTWYVRNTRWYWKATLFEKWQTIHSEGTSITGFPCIRKKEFTHPYRWRSVCVHSQSPSFSMKSSICVHGQSPSFSTKSSFQQATVATTSYSEQSLNQHPTTVSFVLAFRQHAIVVNQFLIAQPYKRWKD